MNREESQPNEGFDDQNGFFLPADHALNVQLRKEDQQLTQMLAEEEKRLKKAERRLEEIGCLLYSAQSHLATGQGQIEVFGAKRQQLQQERAVLQEKIEEANTVYQQRRAQLDLAYEKYLKLQDEKSKILFTLQKIQAYNEQVEAEAAVTKLTSKTAEEQIKINEKQKLKQDYLLDSMSEELRRLNDQKSITAAQIMTQAQETKRVQELLAESEIEREKLLASQRVVMAAWQKSINIVQQMEAALHAIRTAKSEKQDDLFTQNSEIERITNQIRKEAELQEVLQERGQKLQNELKALDSSEDKFKEGRALMEAQYKILVTSLQQTDEQMKQSQKGRTKIETEMNEIEANIMKYHTEVQQLLSDLLLSKNQHFAADKTIERVLKQTQNLERTIADKNIELESIFNEIARIKVDQLNTQSQIESLEVRKKELGNEQQEKTLTVSVYETQIKTGHELNEKKQHEVGRLNKIYEELMSKVQEQSSGTLDAIRSNWRKKINELQRLYDQATREWIVKQETVVRTSQSLAQIQGSIDSLSTKSAILSEKQRRGHEQLNEAKKDIKQIGADLKNLEQDMNKLNDGFYLYRAKEAKLKEENFNIESGFQDRLKRAETEAVRLESEIDHFKEEKANLMEQIVQTEEQILYWERKMTLEKEMQETLDPSVGQSQLEKLRREIHRMELRYQEIKRKQEAQMQETVRCIQKKEIIKLKEVKPKSGADNEPRNMSELIRSSNITRSEYYDANVRQSETETLFKNLQKERLRATLSHYANVYRLKALQLQMSSYESFIKGQPTKMMPTAVLNSRVQRLDEQVQQVAAKINKIVDERPEYQQMLAPLMQLVE